MTEVNLKVSHSQKLTFALYKQKLLRSLVDLVMNFFIPELSVKIYSLLLVNEWKLSIDTGG